MYRDTYVSFISLYMYTCNLMINDEYYEYFSWSVAFTYMSSVPPNSKF